MEPLTLQQIAAACHGDIRAGSPDTVVRRICTDSRQTRPGDLFVALVGEHHDGHAHIPDALAGGTAAVLGTDARLTRPLAGCGVVAVADTRRALGDLAAAYRSRFGLPVLAVAGSNGKTTTKDLIGAVLAQGLTTLTSEASYNNDVGVPLTLLRLERRHQVAVVEAGTNHPGELAALLQQIQPTHGVLTSLGREHLEFFGDFGGVLEEEGWLAALLPAAGTLFVNADSPGIDELLIRTRARVVRVGEGPHTDWQATAATFDTRGMRFEIRAPRPAYDGTYLLPAWGRHQVLNALLALAVGAEFGLTRAQLQAGLDTFHPPKSRLELGQWRGVTLLDDSYNANADSMQAALETLRSLPCEGRRWAVLGDMAELGDHAPAAHAEVGRRAATAAQRLITVGRMAAVTARAAREAGLSEVAECGDVAAAAADLAAAVQPGDLVLVKASRTARLERLVEQFKARLGGDAA